MRTTTLATHPSFRGPVTLTIEQRPNDDELATGFTMARMSQYAQQDATKEIVRRAAYEALSQHPESPVTAVHQWIRAHVKFRPDSEVSRLAGLPGDPEVLIRPVDLLTMPTPEGDCDCISTLAASMLRALGVPSAFKTAAVDPRAQQEYSHVYVMAVTPRGPIAVDASHGPYAGWEVRPIGKTRIWAPRNAGGLGDSEWWQDLLNTGLSTTASIMSSRYSVPQLNQGQYIQRGNQVYYQQQQGASSLAFPGASVGGGEGLWLIGGAVVVVVLVAALGGRR
jgi:hypothetical protein